MLKDICNPQYGPSQLLISNGMNETNQNEQKEIRRNLREQTVGYVTAALGLVAGLAWNDAISNLIAFAFPLSKNSLIAKFAYAVTITFLVVIITGWLFRFARKNGA